MVSLVIVVLAVLAGYVVTVSLALAGTLGLTSTAPRFALAQHRLRAPYKLVHEMLWGLCTVAGGYVAARAGMGVDTMEQQLLLTGTLLFVLWRNTWEARQRGTAHQILISVLTIAGVAGGFALQQRI